MNGMGYQSRMDKEVFHDGKQSLRLWRAAPPVNTNVKAVDPKLASAEWKKVVEHLEASRTAYTKATAHDIDWAIQNARVVLQCMQMRANEVTRDASMAANVKWILDHSPDAKIVLWAHNGHVNTSGYGNYRPMGADLRNIYGDQMVVFGFSFNQGFFSGRRPRRGWGLEGFTRYRPRPPAVSTRRWRQAAFPSSRWIYARRRRPDQWRSGSRSATRRAPSARSTRRTAPYALMADQVAPENFNVILFVEKTTAARKNPMPGQVQYAALPAVEGATEYRDPEVALSLKLPAGWKIPQAVRLPDHATAVQLSNPMAQSITALWFRIPPDAQKLSSEEAFKALATNPDAKAAQRFGEGMTDYKIRAGTLQQRTIGGLPALSCIADFTTGGLPMAEYLVWIRGDKATALFFGRAATGEFDAFRERFDKVIETAKIP